MLNRSGEGDMEEIGAVLLREKHIGRVRGPCHCGGGRSNLPFIVVTVFPPGCDRRVTRNVSG